MGYAPALDKAWIDISNATKEKRLSVKFLGDEYEIDIENRKVLSLSYNTPAKDYTGIILLHYLIQRLTGKALPEPVGNWIDFRQLEGGMGYYPTFKKRTIDTIIRKYGPNPEALLGAIERFLAKKVQVGDIGIVIEVLAKVPILITISRADEEFGPDANILFDENLPNIFCTEDIVVLTEILVHSL